jgi:peptide/nickel transport system ATP-binding protein
MSIILKVEDLKITFPIHGKAVPAVDGISFNLEKGKILGIVGESGCGKTLTALSLLRLIDEPGRIASGKALFFGNAKNLDVEDQDATDYVANSSIIDLYQLPEPELRKIRGNEISMIFQEPMTSLNPVYTIGNQIMEAIQLHQKLNKAEAEEKAIAMLRKVRIPDAEKRIHDYPHQLSGGMRQRVMIAMALSCNPKILIADEPTTALDVTIQAQILELIQELIQEMGMSVILITHDLGVVAQVCQDVHVMYAGKIVEKAPVERLFRVPKHPYTLGLLKSIPQLFSEKEKELFTIKGTVPPLSQIPKGCRFAARCPRVAEACRKTELAYKYVGEDQEVLCLNY